MFKGIFVTGTGTDVGKTYVSCSLARAINKYGICAGVMKPVVTGSRSDVKRLAKAAQISDEISLLNPVFLKYPLAPLVSSRMSGEKISIPKILISRNKLSSKYKFMIVEGIGGALVPITKNYFVIDLIRDFKLPVLVVASSALGTINHTLLTVDKLLSEKIKVAGIVLSSGTGKTLSEKTNAKIINELTGLPVIELKKGKEIDLRKNLWLIGEK